MRVLVLSPRLTEGRRAAFRALTHDLGEPCFVGPGEAPPDVNAGDAIVVDGPQPAQPLELLSAIRAAVERGAALLAVGRVPAERDGFWADLLGVVAGPEPPRGEYYARITEAHSHISARVTREFAVVDGFVPLVPLGDEKVIVDVSVALRDLPAVVEATRGAGRVVACGLGNSDAALRTPELAQLLARALRPDLHCCGRHIGVAIVGYGPLGAMGYHHGLGVTRTEGIELVAVVDPSTDRRKAAEADFPGVRTYTSATELLNDDDVEVAMVATPPAHHAPLTLSLLRGGKHVACEKPLCLTVAEADEIIRAAEASRRMLTVHQNRRWDPDFVAVRRAVDAGLLGEIFNVETFVGGFAHPCRTWHSDTAVSGGAGYDWGSHHIDWVLQLLDGGPRVVQTQGHKRVWHDVTNLDQIRVRMTWRDGREAEFLQSDIAAVRRPKFFVQGTAGTLVGSYRPVTFEHIEPGRGYVATEAHHTEAPADLLLARYESGYGISETRLPPAIEQPFAFHRNLADHLHLGEPLAVTPASVRRVIAVLEAAQRSSMQEGAPVIIDDGG
ncbi:MAG TPA: Gfo/Idh/MocA family oxidoreductase [Candidatus Methylomirabilis sp.]|nr:Gfo/Idh/MocA family oxidoreductase [Candidatus Methylomirabilis sp.]